LVIEFEIYVNAFVNAETLMVSSDVFRNSTPSLIQAHRIPQKPRSTASQAPQRKPSHFVLPTPIFRQIMRINLLNTVVSTSIVLRYTAENKVRGVSREA
jgi:hypothetical protein